MIRDNLPMPIKPIQMRRNLLLLSIFIFSTKMYCQIPEEDAYLPVVPNSPNVSSLSKYEEVAVSKNAGLPDISVPLYTISLDGLSIPVYLSYHAGGIRVNEVAPWTGQNWNLIAGGSITRTVKHLADDFQYGFIFTDITTQMIYDACVGCPSPCTNSDCIEYTKTRVMNNTLDFEPDIFSYNAPGISGKFMFNQVRDQSATGEIKSFPISGNKIIPTFNGLHNITSWEIVDELGNRFFFEIGDRLENTETHTVESAGNLPQEDPMEPYTPEYTQTWNLKRVRTYKGKEVHFQYSEFQNGYHECSFSGLSNTISVGQLNNLKTTYIETEGTTRYLSKIYGDFGSIDIAIDNTPREDHPDGNALKDITVKNSTGEVVKKYVFNYFYTFADNYPGSTIYGCGGAINGTILYDPSNQSNYDPYMKRMFLEEVEVLDKNNVLDHTYAFEYDNEGPLPHRNSYAHDFWGYYNGKTTNSGLLLNVLKPYTNTPDRQVDEKYGQYGLLKRMYHPEGGYTDFEYESNKAIVQAGTTLGYRLVPSDEKTLVFNSSIDTPYETDPSDGQGNTVYKFRKALILNKRAFKLQLGQSSRQFRYVIEQSTSNGQSICLTYDGLPAQGYCSLWVTIRKTTLDPEVYTDPGQINLGTVTYDPGFPLFNQVLNDEEKGKRVEAGVYVVEFHIKTPNSSPILSEFDIENDLAIFSLKYRVAKNDIVFYSNYSEVEIPIGGQRIKSIKTYSDAGVLAKIRDYTYVLEESGKSSGRVLRVPYFVGTGLSGVFESSLTSVPLLTTSSNNVNYTRVEEEVIDVQDNQQKITQINTFSFHELPQLNENPMVPFLEDWRYGQLLVSETPLKNKSTQNYDDNFVWFTSDPSSYHYGVLPPTTSIPYQLTSLNGIYGYTLPPASVSGYITGDTFYKLQYGAPTLNAEVNKLYFDNDPNKVVTTTKMYEYENTSHFKPTTVITNTSDSNKSMTTKTKYADDLPSDPYMNDLIAENRIAEPVQTETYKKEGAVETRLATRKTVYGDFNGLILPQRLQTAKANNPPANRIQYDQYDAYGNPLQVSKASGAKISYIYGYNHQYPVAKIENATYSQATSVSGLNMAVIDDPSSDNALRNEIDKIRQALPNALVTTYTYKPLVGVTSITDPKDDRVTYHYDAFGRLEYAKDKDGNLLEEHEYHYRD